LHIIVEERIGERIPHAEKLQVALQFHKVRVSPTAEEDLLLLLPLAFSAQAQQKIGIVNTAVIMEALPDVKAATTKIQDLAKQYDAEIKRMQDEMKTKLEAYQKEEATMTEVIKKRRQQELQEMEARIQNSYQMMQEEVQKEHEKLVNGTIECLVMIIIWSYKGMK